MTSPISQFPKGNITTSLLEKQYSIFERIFPSSCQEKTKGILSGCKFFFITGMGRSGTTFLANLLDELPETSVFHETRLDFIALNQAYGHPEKAYKYINGFRSTVIASRILQSKCKLYGEVNSLLRFHVNPLRQLKNVKILHLVRDGRLVVRSIMGRTAFTPLGIIQTGQIKPLKDDPYQEQWLEMSRFEKVCWYWSSTVKYLLQQQIPLIRFEDVIHSYEQFEHQLLEPLQIEIPYERWNTERVTPINAGSGNKFPSWKAWTVEQQNQFQEICGEVMNELDYHLK